LKFLLTYCFIISIKIVAELEQEKTQRFKSYFFVELKTVSFLWILHTSRAKQPSLHLSEWGYIHTQCAFASKINGLRCKKKFSNLNFLMEQPLFLLLCSSTFSPCLTVSCTRKDPLKMLIQKGIIQGYEVKVNIIFQNNILHSLFLKKTKANWCFFQRNFPYHREHFFRDYEAFRINVTAKYPASMKVWEWPKLQKICLHCKVVFQIEVLSIAPGSIIHPGRIISIMFC